MCITPLKFHSSCGTAHTFNALPVQEYTLWCVHTAYSGVYMAIYLRRAESFKTTHATVRSQCTHAMLHKTARLPVSPSRQRAGSRVRALEPAKSCNVPCTILYNQ